MNEITINVIDESGKKHKLRTPLEMGLNLMDVLRSHDLVEGACGGMALCAAWHCYIESQHDLNQKGADEEDMLDQLQNTNFDKSRLICQIPICASLDGIVLRIVRD